MAGMLRKQLDERQWGRVEAILRAERNDAVIARGLIERVLPSCLLGDKAYDTKRDSCPAGSD
jgi:hypothetical protein